MSDPGGWGRAEGEPPVRSGSSGGGEDADPSHPTSNDRCTTVRLRRLVKLFVRRASLVRSRSGARLGGSIMIVGRTPRTNSRTDNSTISRWAKLCSLSHKVGGGQTFGPMSIGRANHIERTPGMQRRTLAASFRDAFKGLGHTLLTQRNAKIQLAVGLATLLLGAGLR